MPGRSGRPLAHFGLWCPVLGSTLGMFTRKPGLLGGPSDVWCQHHLASAQPTLPDHKRLHAGPWHGILGPTTGHCSHTSLISHTALTTHPDCLHFPQCPRPLPSRTPLLLPGTHPFLTPTSPDKLQLTLQNSFQPQDALVYTSACTPGLGGPG